MTKITDIAKAWIKDLPEGEDWFEHRRNVCNTCPFNSKNGAALTLPQQAIELVNKESGVCSLCSCPTWKKASLKTEKCPSNPPKWTSIETKAEGAKLKSYSISLDDKDLKVKFLNDRFVISGGKTEDKYFLKFMIRSSSDVELLRVIAGCTCTVPSPKKVRDNEYEISLSINKQEKAVHKVGIQVEFTRKNMTGKGALIQVPVDIKFEKL